MKNTKTGTNTGSGDRLASGLSKATLETRKNIEEPAPTQFQGEITFNLQFCT